MSLQLSTSRVAQHRRHARQPFDPHAGDVLVTQRAVLADRQRRTTDSGDTELNVPRLVAPRTVRLRPLRFRGGRHSRSLRDNEDFAPAAGIMDRIAGLSSAARVTRPTRREARRDSVIDGTPRCVFGAYRHSARWNRVPPGARRRRPCGVPRTRWSRRAQLGLH